MKMLLDFYTNLELELIKVNVYLKDGTEYLGKDIPASPFGKNETIISFGTIRSSSSSFQWI
jgi:hypothetical protein